MPHLLKQIQSRIPKHQHVLVITTNRNSVKTVEGWLRRRKIRCGELHYKMGTDARSQVLTDFRQGKTDVLVGINMLREGMDLINVPLVAILNAHHRDKTSLIQIIGRATRHEDGTVILYAPTVIRAMTRAIMETRRRRQMQQDYNREHHKTPKSIR